MEIVSFRQPHSRAIRIWHWSTVIVVSLMLFTVFGDKILLNRFRTSAVIHDTLSSQGVIVSPGQAWQVSEAIDKHIWDLHVKLGYVLAGLFMFRLVTELLQRKNERFFPLMMKALFQIRRVEERRQTMHYLAVRLIYLLFYMLLTTIIITGTWMAFHRPPVDESQYHAVKEIHEACFNFLLIFILVHTTGVILAERRNDHSLLSGMIKRNRTGS